MTERLDPYEIFADDDFDVATFVHDEFPPEPGTAEPEPTDR
jgi:hypothetical protein